MRELTSEQQAMLDSCIVLNAAWTTAAECENDQMLKGWVDRGWARRIDPPTGLRRIHSYIITEAGRRALSDQQVKL